MKLSYKINQVKSKNLLNIAVDVSKDELNVYSEIGSVKIQCIQDLFPNTISDIENKLKEYIALAQLNNYDNIQVVCEPTGGYEKKLLRKKILVSSLFSIHMLMLAVVFFYFA